MGCANEWRSTAVVEASDGRETIEAVNSLSPEVVLMDIRMPNLDGIEATRRIAKGDRSPRVLILTTFDLDEYVYEALRAARAASCSKTSAPTSSCTQSGLSRPVRLCSLPRSHVG